MTFLRAYPKLTHNANGDYNIGPMWGITHGYANGDYNIGPTWGIT
jgi:hypothetical protein